MLCAEDGPVEFQLDGARSVVAVLCVALRSVEPTTSRSGTSDVSGGSRARQCGCRRCGAPMCRQLCQYDCRRCCKCCVYFDMFANSSSVSQSAGAVKDWILLPREVVSTLYASRSVREPSRQVLAKMRALKA